MVYNVGSWDDPALLSMPATGGKPIKEAVAATRRLRAHGVHLFYPSPDGKWIAGFGPQFEAILITRTTGSAVVTLTKGNFPYGGLIWSPETASPGDSALAHGGVP